MPRYLLALALLSLPLNAVAEDPAVGILTPLPPAEVRVERTYTTAVFRWEPVPQVSHYRIEMVTRRYLLWEEHRTIERHESTSFQLRFPYGLSRYTVRVYAVAGPAVSPPSRESTVTSPLFGGLELHRLYHAAG